MGRLSPAEVLERYFPDPGPMTPLFARLDRTALKYSELCPSLN